MIQAGAVVLVDFPQHDGTTKPRPALVAAVLPAYNDLLICAISTQLHQRIADVDILIEEGDADFAGSGLRSRSIVRITSLAMIAQDAKRLRGAIGHVSESRLQAVQRNLARLIYRG